MNQTDHTEVPTAEASTSRPRGMVVHTAATTALPAIGDAAAIAAALDQFHQNWDPDVEAEVRHRLETLVALLEEFRSPPYHLTRALHLLGDDFLSSPPSGKRGETVLAYAHDATQRIAARFRPIVERLPAITRREDSHLAKELVDELEILAGDLIYALRHTEGNWPPSVLPVNEGLRLYHRSHGVLAGDTSARPAVRQQLVVTLENLDPFEHTLLEKLLTDKLPTLVRAARQENAEQRIRRLLEAIAPADPLADIQERIAEDTLELRREFLSDVPCLTSKEVHVQAGFSADGNPSQTVHRWRKQRKIFAVSFGGRDHYPRFQFGSDGRPLPIIAELLAILGRAPQMSDWDIALWFASETGWLDGHSPIEWLNTQPEAVKTAAEQEVLADDV